MSLAASINFNQMILHIRSVFANLQDSLHYLCTVSTHTMDYIDAATSGILSPHVLPVTDLQKMHQHITDTLPPILPLTNITRGHPTFLQVLTYTCLDREQTVLITDQYSNTG